MLAPRLLIVAAAFPALALASAGAPAGVAVVTVSPRGFEPPELSIHAGDTVTWTNTGTNQHEIASDTAAFKSSPVLQPGQSWSFTFHSKGLFAYHDDQHTDLRGSVAVAAAPPSVTIGAARPAVTYGGGLTLTGRVSSRRAGERVLVVTRTCGQVSSGQAGAVTRADGLWRLVVHPLRTTAYGVSWGQIASPGFRVSVLPRIRLARAAGGYSARVTAATSFPGRTIVLQRWDEAEASWAITATARLRSAGPTVPPTLLSIAMLKTTGGGRVRAMLSAAQAAPCYGQSLSNVVDG